MTELLAKDDGSYAAGMLGGSSKDGIAKLDDILSSPSHFALFLNVLGPELDDSTPGSPAIPCAAVVGHPSLLGATASAFGSNMDNFVLRTDCKETLPAIPALNSLDAKLWKKWPDCEGTIRFAAYRTYDVALDVARLGFTKHEPKASLVQRDGVKPVDVAAARSELAAYYVQYLGKTPTQARSMASDAIITILNDAHECE
jgi:hypothetical protein